MGYTYGSIIDKFEMGDVQAIPIDLTTSGYSSPKGVFFSARRWSDAGEMLENLIVEKSGKHKKEVYGRDCAPTCAYKLVNRDNEKLYLFFEGPKVYLCSGINGVKED